MWMGEMEDRVGRKGKGVNFNENCHFIDNDMDMIEVETNSETTVEDATAFYTIALGSSDRVRLWYTCGAASSQCRRRTDQPTSISVSIKGGIVRIHLEATET